MYQYDKVTMQRTDGVFVCIGNVVVEQVLSPSQEEDLMRYGFIFEEVNEDHIDILVNRLDVSALATATTAFFNQYS